MINIRKETDSLGGVEGALQASFGGAQTQRALEHSSIGNVQERSDLILSLRSRVACQWPVHRRDARSNRASSAIVWICAPSSCLGGESCTCPAETSGGQLGVGWRGGSHRREHGRRGPGDAGH